MKQAVIKPLVTEKTLSRAGNGWYTFVVSLQARKAQIARDIADMYSVKVTTVRTARIQGKVRRAGKKQSLVAASAWKKAMVQLAPGGKIDAFETVQEGEKK